MNLISKVRETIKRYKMFDFGDKVVIGVSGGPDSVCLLYILNSLKDEFGLSLHIGHLDHMLRKDSFGDLLFVKGIAERLGLSITTERVDVSKLAKKGSIEEIARKLRFDFLFRVAENIGTKKIALGHNKDDQAETVLLRILRGAGLYGLGGILPKRGILGFAVTRPLIEIKRKEIESYLKKRKIRTREDITNIQDLYFRNRVRNKLLPLLEKEYNPKIKEILFNMAENIGSDYEYLEAKSRKLLEKLKIKDEKLKINLNLRKITSFHPAIQRMLLRLAISDLKGDTRKLTFKHFREIEDLFRNRPDGSIVDLPLRISIQKKKETLSVYLR